MFHLPQTFHFMVAFCFVSQVVPGPSCSTSPVSVGPAWMAVPVGQSVLVVARGSRWAQTRLDATFPTPGLKQQPPSNVWAPSPTPGVGCRPPLPCCHLNLCPSGDGSRRQIDALMPSSLHPAGHRLEWCGFRSKGVHC